ncbi:hypothetical protein ACVW1A_004812 [Bradyrhizobium sp. LB1.3]
MLRWPRVPVAAATATVWNEDWFWSASAIESTPVAVRLPAAETPTSSVTSWTTGAPMTAASLVPWMVKVTCFWVPSSAVRVKVSTLVSPTPRYCTALSSAA